MAGCGDPDVLPRPAQSATAPVANAEMFEYVADNLQRLPEFAPGEILDQVVQRLNEWAEAERPVIPWQPDSLISTLPPVMRDSLLERLDEIKFNKADGFFLQEAVWMRDASAAAIAAARHNGLPKYFDADDDRQKAAAIFDWVVRNIQLDEGEAAKRIPLRPWEVLVLGHGSEIERCWLYMTLARQQHLDVVILYTPGETPGEGRLWANAHFHQGQLYLYDMRLGLPVPGPNGKGIATLAQAAADPGVLKQLDLEGTPYPETAANVKEVVAMVEADAPYLSRRMRVVEARLTGKNKVVLSVAAGRLAEPLSKSPHLRDVRIWRTPYEYWYARSQPAPQEAQMALGRELSLMSLPLTKFDQTLVQEDREGGQAINRPVAPRQPNEPAEGDAKFVERERTIYPLWSGRQRHFQGRHDRPEGAQAPGADTAADTAKSLYLEARLVREDEKVAPADETARQLRGFKADMHGRATYWLGLVNYDQGNFPLATQFFTEVSKLAPPPKFHAGALYNLGRCAEATGQKDVAVKFYEDPAVNMPQGCRLRARWLKQTGPADASAKDKAAPEKPQGK